MTVSTYAELQTAIGNYAHRDDTTFTNRVTEFISSAEARMNDLHLLHNYESEESLSLTTSVNYVAVPSGYISPIALWLIVNSERVLLEPALPQELPYRSTNGQPAWWAIDGANIRFDCPADSGYSGKFRMLKSSNLSGTNTTNALLTKRPDVYLAACLVEAARWMANDKLFQMYESQFLRGVKELKAVENRSRAMVPMRVDSALSSRGAYDINKG